MLGHHSGVEDKLFVAVIPLLNVETVRHQRMPVVQGVELGCDAVLVLEALVEQQLRVELEFEVISTQVLNIVLDHNFDGLA